MADKLYDVVVVGSGAGRGTLPSRLAELGVDTLVLEGAKYNSLNAHMTELGCTGDQPMAGFPDCVHEH